MPKFIQIATHSGTGDVDETIYALDDSGDVWWLVPGPKQCWSRLPPHPDAGDSHEDR
jgi:hypothetical protein